MRFLHQSLALSVAAGLGLTIGFVWRGNATHRRESPELRTEMTTKPDAWRTSVSSNRTVMTHRSHDDSPLATQLARDLFMSSRVTRWLYWTEAIERASLPDFPRLAALANGDGTATRLLALRWAELDLRHLFDTLAAAPDRRTLPTDELAEVLFYEWARRDPDGAIAALGGTNRFGTRDTWRFNLAGFLVEKDPERGLRALSEWGIDNFAPLMTGVAKWAATAPRHAAEVVLANPAGYTSELAMETIAKQWAKVDPVGALEFASSRPGELASSLGSAVLKNWAAQNINDAADWLGRAGSTTRHRLSPAFVEAWAKADLTNALAWCELNLRGSSLAQTVRAVVSGAAQKDLLAAAEFVSNRTVSPVRSEAAVAVAKNWIPGWRSGKPVPAAAIAWMAGLDAASTRRVLEEVQWKWSNGDPKSMAEFVASAGSDRVPASADLNVARALARQNPLDAFAWASRLPADRDLAAGREAFAEWLHSQPESAMKWLNDLPVSDARRKLFLK